MKILFTGAGFSRNWGGFLAKDVSGLLVSHRNFSCAPEIRELLLRSKNYEEAYAKVMRRSPESLNLFDAALVDVFTKQDRLTSRPSRTVNGHQLRQFLGLLNDMAGGGAAFVFTVNQDLLLERLLLHQHPQALWPGINRRFNWLEPQGRDWTEGDLYDIEDREAPYPQGQLNYVKLHGSFDWRLRGRPLLIAGEQKEDAVRHSKLLSSYYETFERALTTPPVDILVIGYSFSDRHINRVFGKALHPDFRLFVVDPKPMGEWADQINKDDSLRPLVRFTHGYWPWTLSDIFPSGNAGPDFSEFYKDIWQAFVDS
jgi:hypothetical protein